MKTKPVLALVLLLVIPACAVLKPVIKTVNNLAYDLCVAEHAQGKQGLSAAEIGEAFCATEIALKPFLDAILSAKAKLHAASASVSASVVRPPVVAPAASASASAKPVVSAKPAVSAAPKAAK